MDIEKLLEGYSSSNIRAAEGIVRTLKDNGIDTSELGSMMAVTQRNIEKISEERVSTGRSRRTARKQARDSGRTKRSKPRVLPYLKPGDSAALPGVKCAKCDGGMIYEALCGKTAQKKGCIRIGLCIECGSEIRIK